jgi:hypothetical protein
MDGVSDELGAVVGDAHARLTPLIDQRRQFAITLAIELSAISDRRSRVASSMTSGATSGHSVSCA